MTVIGLDGREYRWNLRQNPPRDKCSRPHELVREELRREYPCDVILEEVYLPGHGGYLDFYLPFRRLAVEVQGRQHTEYVEFFHKDHLGFCRSVQRDQRKARWCEINEITLEQR